MLEEHLSQNPYVVWDTQIHDFAERSDTPSPEEVVDGISRGTTALVVTPDARSTIMVLCALDVIPANIRYVVAVFVWEETPVAAILENVPDTAVLAGFDGTRNFGTFADLFDFSLEFGKRAVTLKEVPEDIKEMLVLHDNGNCLKSVADRLYLPRAFGKQKLAPLSNAVQKELASVLGHIEDLKFLPDDFPAWKRRCLGAVNGALSPMLAENTNSIDAAREAMFELKSRVPELVRYRPLWLAVMKQQAEKLKSDGVEFEGILETEGLAGRLDELGEEYGISSMMEAVDEGVPSEDVVLSTFGSLPSSSPSGQQQAFDRLVEHMRPKK